MPDLELAARLRCDPCQATVFHLYRRRARQADGTPVIAYEHVLWPVSPYVLPPTRPERITCPDCGSALRQVAA
jgi:hypothetical protein